MTTVALTASPATIDPGTAYELTVLNSGSSVVHVQIGGGSVYDQRLNPGQSVVVHPNGQAVTGFARSGTGQVDTTLATNPEPPVSTGTSTPPASGLRYGPRCVFLGDSITAADSDSSGNVQGNSWATYFSIASGGRAQIVRNSGVGGNTTAQMLARFTADVLAYAPDVVFILGGTNDLGGATPQPTAKANITAMVQAALAAGVRPVLATIPPSGTGAIGSPSAPALWANNTTGGTIPAGTYSFSISAINGAGETTGGGILSGVVTTGSTSSIQLNWPVVHGASGYGVYMNDGTNGWKKVVTVGTINGSTWVAAQTTTITSYTGTAGVPGSNTTARAITTSDRGNIPKINRWIKRYARANHLDCIDFYQMLGDGVSGQYATGYTRDGTHPSVKGARIMGAAAWAQLGPLWSQSSPLLAGDNSDPTNLMSNGLMVNATSGLPTGWSSSGGLGSSFTDAVGVVAAFTNAGYVGNAFTTTRAIPDVRLHSGPAISTGFSVGDTIAFAVAVQTTGVEAAGALVNVDLKCAGSSPTAYVQAAQIGGDVGPGLLYGELVVPAGTTSLQPDQHVSNGVGTYSAITAQWTVVNLTTGAVLTP